ncbi:MAG: L-fucose isomerase [Kosmotogaceae bacterium]
MIKDFPKIGIRPVIDGRRKGIRESLESQTMELAKKVANLLENKLMYIDGSPVKTCISDTTIGGYAESVKCAEKFERENVGVSLTVTPCWCYGSEVMDENPLIPKAIWGFNGSERPGAVFLAAVSAAHDQKGLPAFAIYGKDVQDSDNLSIPEDVKTKILKFARAALAVAFMRKKAYLSIGSVSMGIAGSMVNEDFFEKYLGMHVEYSDMSEIIRRIEEEIYDKKEYKKALDWVRRNCKEGIDINSKEKQFIREEKDKQWEFIVKMTIIIRDMMIGNLKLKEMNFGEEAEGHYAIASGFQGQRQWTDHFPNGDFSEAILNSSFDWNGIRNPFIVATENDSLNAVSMLFGYLLTNTPQIFSDVRTYWSPEAVRRVTGKSLDGKAKDGVIHLKNSGSTTLDGTGKEKDVNGNSVMKPFWEITEDEMEKCLEATEWCPANVEYFRGGGFSSKFLTEGEMPITMCRINIVKGLGPVLQIAEGYTVKLDKEVNKILDERTDPSWPTTWFAPKLTGKGAFKDVYSVMNNWGANHGAISYGHIGAELIALASILRIPVSMHNVKEDRIFRPKTWAAFGTENLESADYRACKALGPLYGIY